MLLRKLEVQEPRTDSATDFMGPSLNQKPMKLRLLDSSKLNHLKAIPLRLRKKD